MKQMPTQFLPSPTTESNLPPPAVLQTHGEVSSALLTLHAIFSGGNKGLIGSKTPLVIKAIIALYPLSI